MQDGHSINSPVVADILGALYQSKYVIAGLSVAACIFSVTVSMNIDKVYRSEVLIQPVIAENVAGGGGVASKIGGLGRLAGLTSNERDPTEEALAILESRQFTIEFIEENQLLPILLPKDGSSKAHKEEPTVMDAYKLFDEKVRTIERDRQSGMVRLVIEWKDPKLAANWANQLIARVNEYLRQRAIADARRSLEFLGKESDAVHFASLRTAVTELMEGELRKVMLATVHKEYAFKIIDPAVAAKKPSKPNRMLIIAAGTIAGAFLGCLVSLIWQAFKLRRGRGKPLSTEQAIV